jgi:hypothetical protein
MQHFDGQYHGAALQSFIRGLGHSQQIIDQILRDNGLHRIEPDQWYDLNTARAIYMAIAKQVGDRSLHAVGLKMIESAPFPPQIDDVASVLASLGAAYHMNVRGSNIGDISATFVDERSAVVVCSTPFPCALERGIVQGCCKKFGATALIEHGDEGCRDQGAPACSYRVTW